MRILVCYCLILFAKVEMAGAESSPIVYSAVVSCTPECILHEPVVVTVKFRNVSNMPVRIDLGWNREGNFSFDMMTPSGHRVSVNPLQAAGGVGGLCYPSNVTIEPGKDYVQALVLDKWYEPDEIGTYTLTLHSTAAIANVEGGVSSTFPDQQFSISITPRDPAVLAEKCTALVDEVKAKRVYAEQVGPAQALAYVRDPVAVPFLMQVYSSYPLLGGVAISGLGRIGTPDAVRALIDILRSTPNQNYRALTRNTFLDVARSTRDEKLKQEIQREVAIGAPH